MKALFHRLRDDETAASLTEYGLLIAAIGAGVFAASVGLSESIKSFFTSLSSTLGSPG